MLGTRIALLRREKKLSQKELAARLGVRPSTVGMYEQGRREPDCATLVELARLLEVSTDFLLTGIVSVPQDLRALRGVRDAAQRALDGTLLLRASDGTERPFGGEELAQLLAVLLG